MVLDKAPNPLPFPVTFVSLEPEIWPELFCSNGELIDEEITLDPNTIPCSRLNRIDPCWIVLTYLQLKRRGLNVRLSNRFIPGEICVVSAPNYFPTLTYTSSSFVVGCRGDGTRPSVCHFVVSQSQFCVKSKTDVFIPHWPQPGLIPRCQERGNRIEHIVFKGAELAEEFRSADFCQALEQFGVKFSIHDNSKDGALNWHDYRDADLVLAVRDHPALMKPASKLINAWKAGVPALLGPEPAFQELRRSSFDYIEVKTPDDALSAIRRLQQNPQLYQQMIDHGLRRAEAFTADRIAQRWRDVLAGPVAEAYVFWKQRSRIKHQMELSLKTAQQHVIWQQEKMSQFCNRFSRLKKVGESLMHWSL